MIFTEDRKKPTSSQKNKKSTKVETPKRTKFSKPTRKRNLKPSYRENPKRPLQCSKPPKPKKEETCTRTDIRKRETFSKRKKNLKYSKVSTAKRISIGRVSEKENMKISKTNRSSTKRKSMKSDFYKNKAKRSVSKNRKQCLASYKERNESMTGNYGVHFSRPLCEGYGVSLDILIKARRPTIPGMEEYNVDRKLLDLGMWEIKDTYNQTYTLDLKLQNICVMRGVCKMPNLVELDLSMNKIDVMAGLDSLVRLERLDLGYNEIQKIESLSGCVNLKWLNLRNNQIENIEGLNNCKQLILLNLAHNRVASFVSIAYMRQFRKLQCFDLENNPVLSKAGGMNYFLAMVPQARFSLKNNLVRNVRLKEANNEFGFDAVEYDSIRRHETVTNMLEARHMKVAKVKAESFVQFLENDAFFMTQFEDEPDSLEVLKLIRMHTPLAISVRDIYFVYHLNFRAITDELFEYGLAQSKFRTKELAHFTRVFEQQKLKAHGAYRECLKMCHEKKEKLSAKIAAIVTEMDSIISEAGDLAEMSVQSLSNKMPFYGKTEKLQKKTNSEVTVFVDELMELLTDWEFYNQNEDIQQLRKLFSGDELNVRETVDKYIQFLNSKRKLDEREREESSEGNGSENSTNQSQSVVDSGSGERGNDGSQSVMFENDSEESSEADEKESSENDTEESLETNSEESTETESSNSTTDTEAIHRFDDFRYVDSNSGINQQLRQKKEKIHRKNMFTDSEIVQQIRLEIEECKVKREMENKTKLKEKKHRMIEKQKERESDSMMNMQSNSKELQMEEKDVVENETIFFEYNTKSKREQEWFEITEAETVDPKQYSPTQSAIMFETTDNYLSSLLNENITEETLNDTNIAPRIREQRKLDKGIKVFKRPTDEERIREILGPKKPDSVIKIADFPDPVVPPRRPPWWLKFVHRKSETLDLREEPTWIHPDPSYVELTEQLLEELLKEKRSKSKRPFGINSDFLMKIGIYDRFEKSKFHEETGSDNSLVDANDTLVESWYDASPNEKIDDFETVIHRISRQRRGSGPYVPGERKTQSVTIKHTKSTLEPSPEDSEMQQLNQKNIRRYQQMVEEKMERAKERKVIRQKEMEREMRVENEIGKRIRFHERALPLHEKEREFCKQVKKVSFECDSETSEETERFMNEKKLVDENNKSESFVDEKEKKKKEEKIKKEKEEEVVDEKNIEKEVRRRIQSEDYEFIKSANKTLRKMAILLTSRRQFLLSRSQSESHVKLLECQERRNRRVTEMITEVLAEAAEFVRKVEDIQHMLVFQEYRNSFNLATVFRKFRYTIEDNVFDVKVKVFVKFKQMIVLATHFHKEVEQVLLDYYKKGDNKEQYQSYPVLYDILTIETRQWEAMDNLYGGMMDVLYSHDDEICTNISRYSEILLNDIETKEVTRNRLVLVHVSRIVQSFKDDIERVLGKMDLAKKEYDDVFVLCTKSLEHVLISK